MRPVRIVALDFETTGSVKGWSNEPWQLGLVEIGVDGLPITGTQREFFFHIDPARPFSIRAPGRWASIRNLLAEAPMMMEQWEMLAPILTGSVLVAHNATTERTVLEKVAPLTAFGPWVDTLKLARKNWPGLPSYTLGDLVKEKGCLSALDAFCPKRTWHDALYDAVAGAFIFSQLRSYITFEELG